VGNGVGIRFRAGAADDDFYSVTGSIDEAAIARRERDREQIRIARCTEGQSIAFRVGGETPAEVTVEGFVVCEVDSRGLAVKADPADAAFLAKDGTTDLVIAIGAGGGGGLGESEGELDPFIFHERDLFFGEVEAVKDTVEYRGEDNSKKGDEHDSGEKGVGGGE
jgi:hypothetical protein